MPASLVARVRPLLPRPIEPGARAAYRHLTGRGSRVNVERRMARAAAAKTPTTYNEKIRFKMAFDRRPILTELADKVASRAFVAERIGEEFLTEVYAIAEDPRRIPWNDLPREFAAKVNHASGGMVLVSDGADPDRELPDDLGLLDWARIQLSPDRMDTGRLIAVLAHWLHHDYSWFPGKGVVEWAYRNVPRKVMVEELLRGPDGQPPRDLKFTVAGGELLWIQVDSSRFGAHTKDLMDAAWQRLPVEYNRVPVSKVLPERPRHLDRMVEAALEVARGLEFLRVDFYEIGDRVIFGELTHYPACGNGRIRPEHFDAEWGAITGWHCEYGSTTTKRRSNG